VGPRAGIRDIEVIAAGLGGKPGVGVVAYPVAERRRLPDELSVLVCRLVGVGAPLAVDEPYSYTM